MGGGHSGLASPQRPLQPQEPGTDHGDLLVPAGAEGQHAQVSTPTSVQNDAGRHRGQDREHGMQSALEEPRARRRLDTGSTGSARWEADWCPPSLPSTVLGQWATGEDRNSGRLGDRGCTDSLPRVGTWAAHRGERRSGIQGQVSQAPCLSPAVPAAPCGKCCPHLKSGHNQPLSSIGWHPVPCTPRSAKGEGWGLVTGGDTESLPFDEHKTGDVKKYRQT